MAEFRELSWNPFEGLPLVFLDKLIEYGEEKGILNVVRLLTKFMKNLIGANARFPMC